MNNNVSHETTPLVFNEGPVPNTRALSSINEALSGATESGSTGDLYDEDNPRATRITEATAAVPETPNTKEQSQQDGVGNVTPYRAASPTLAAAKSLHKSSYLHTVKQIQLSNRVEKFKKAISLSGTSFRNLLQREPSSTNRNAPNTFRPLSPDGNRSVDSTSNYINAKIDGGYGATADVSGTQPTLFINPPFNTSIRSIISSAQRSRQSSIDEELNSINGGDKDGNEEHVKEEDEAEEVKLTTTDILIDIFFGKGIVSLCLLAMPFAILSKYLNWSPTWIFWLNFIVMIPLASILGDFTEEVAVHTNETVGGLINASFGNAVEIIIGIQALLANEIRVVQASMLGSIFSNLLLVLGCCFFFGGMYHKEQSFNATAAGANVGLLALSSIALVLPTPFAEYYNIRDEHVLIISRFSAIFLIFMYIQLLVFQLKTHAYLFDNDDDDDDDDDEEEDDDDDDNTKPKKEEELSAMTFGEACLGLLIVTCLVALFSEFLVGSIEGFTEDSGVSRTFVGIVILPIVGNAVEHVTAVTVAIKDKMDLAMGIALGSCTQISLFVAPLTVILGWYFNKPMTLNFPIFEIALYVLSIFTVSVVCSNPRCNWLEGSLLVTTYALIAVGFWFEQVQTEQ